MSQYCCISQDINLSATPVNQTLEADSFEDVYIEFIQAKNEPFEEEEREFFKENAKYDRDMITSVCTILTDDDECLLVFVELPNNSSVIISQ